MTTLTMAFDVVEVKGTEVLVRTEREAKPFWVPAKYLYWTRDPEPGKFIAAAFPDWLADMCPELAGDPRFEEAKQLAEEKEQIECPIRDNFLKTAVQGLCSK